jgi:peptidoglycan/LPS O-acetylase OafA/YrhL
VVTPLTSLAPTLTPVAVTAPSPEPAARRAGGHVPALDGVRGLAILAVLLFHFAKNARPTDWFERVVVQALNYGSLGVDLFFALSGFLITGILFDSHAEPSYFRSFYMRRALRIFPLYYGVLAIVFFVLPLVPALQGTDLANLGRFQSWAWLYGVNIYLSMQGGWVMSYLTHFWSLAVEEHFYLFWPLVVWALARQPQRLMQAAAGLAAISFVARQAAALAGVNVVALTVLTPFQLDALCLGGFFAIVMRQPGGAEKVKRAVIPLAVVPALVIVALWVANNLTDSLRLATSPLRSGMLRLVLVALLLRTLTAPDGAADSRFFRSGFMRFLGKYSYGIYVYHHFLSFHATATHTLQRLTEMTGSLMVALVLQQAVGIAASIAIAWLSYELFEKHFLRLKRFWPSSRESVAVPAR